MYFDISNEGSRQDFRGTYSVYIDLYSLMLHIMELPVEWLQKSVNISAVPLTLRDQ